MVAAMAFLNLSASHFRKEGGFWFKGNGYSGLLTEKVLEGGGFPQGWPPPRRGGKETKSGGIGICERWRAT